MRMPYADWTNAWRKLSRVSQEALTSVTLDYQVPVSGAEAHLLLTFFAPSYSSPTRWQAR